MGGESLEHEAFVRSLTAVEIAGAAAEALAQSAEGDLNGLIECVPMDAKQGILELLNDGLDDSHPPGEFIPEGVNFAGVAALAYVALRRLAILRALAGRGDVSASQLRAACRAE